MAITVSSILEGLAFSLEPHSWRLLLQMMAIEKMICDLSTSTFQFRCICGSSHRVKPSSEIDSRHFLTVWDDQLAALIEMLVAFAGTSS